MKYLTRTIRILSIVSMLTDDGLTVLVAIIGMVILDASFFRNELVAVLV